MYLCICQCFLFCTVVFIVLYSCTFLGLFGNNQNKGFGFGTFGAAGTNPSLGTSGLSTGFGLTGFNTQPQQQQQNG